MAVAIVRLDGGKHAFRKQLVIQKISVGPFPSIGVEPAGCHLQSRLHFTCILTLKGFCGLL